FFIVRDVENKRDRMEDKEMKKMKFGERFGRIDRERVMLKEGRMEEGEDMDMYLWNERVWG
uniref:hypothetical protein n=1 Tax=Bacillus sp. WP8 TaxID=756828 RepID=UPI001C930FEA